MVTDIMETQWGYCSYNYKLCSNKPYTINVVSFAILSFQFALVHYWVIVIYDVENDLEL
jgi:hypothetical protein